MAWAKGQSGNPEGRKTEKVWRDAIMLAVNDVQGSGAEAKKKLRMLAEKLVEEGLAGDVSAIKEIGDRLDGKAVQALSGDNEDGSLTINIVRFTA